MKSHRLTRYLSNSHAPRMFLIYPVDPHHRRELGFLPQNFTF
jgi:hypothetical protein